MVMKIVSIPLKKNFLNLVSLLIVLFKLFSVSDRLPAGANEVDGVKDYFSKQLKSDQALAWVCFSNIISDSDILKQSISH